MTCPYCLNNLRELDRLRREVKALRSQLEMPVDDVAWALQMFNKPHIQPQEAVTCAILYAAKGNVVTRAYLYDNIPSPNERTNDSRILPTLICRLRQKLGGKHTIENVWGQGYRLTAEGIRIVDTLREQALDRTTGRA
jgi:DNA-binding response OmpR family regulator